ncbi:COQ9 family protein [Rhodobaculum claviforme]|uniref:Ubiquinone biosynthesis protein n=1 Tax=Rhodobaculum claviforme TaxID=1549854 RepID=A0A934TM69_9RHOB|nr:COQ9 family protein [Rhodobaculum claviforme]MBK5928670.1 ubiquinone biosynthesis protein [Rhodobaculum claviforme]
MQDTPTPTETDTPTGPDAVRAALLEAALPHVPFDGWADATFRAAIEDAGIDPALARATCPRGGVDLALAYHARGDARMVARLHREALGAMRMRDRIATAVRLRLEVVEEKDAVRRGATLFALPQYAADGARAIWGTADLIWTTLGDTAEDVNWYTKRATLAGVYSSTLLYWLGDTTPNHQATWEFLDRRIDDVMRFEKVKGTVGGNAVFRTVFAGPLWLLGQVRAPMRPADVDLPGMRAPDFGPGAAPDSGR